ncbi:MAG: hypothetical protein CL677_08490 [Bdellovibrionaceae bacterium]|nr:hypothetical protein [Pseudobdellovibrionaceae bacterium]|tara:strand:- start:20 stop:571 length:552 start_codon:yes stop_codon:yes gene_type:complete
MRDMWTMTHFKSIEELNEVQRQKIVEIFFESSSKKDFTNEVEAFSFFYKWTVYYFSAKYPGESFLYNGVNGNPLGYLSGTDNSLKAQPYFDQINTCYSIFEEEFKRFPAHFHINVAAEARGNRIGSQLIQRYTDHLRHKNISGVHIVTAANARNRDFYRQNGFIHEVEKTCRKVPLVFMGKIL